MPFVLICIVSPKIPRSDTDSKQTQSATLLLSLGSRLLCQTAKSGALDIYSASIKISLIDGGFIDAGVPAVHRSPIDC